MTFWNFVIGSVCVGSVGLFLSFKFDQIRQLKDECDERQREYGYLQNRLDELKLQHEHWHETDTSKIRELHLRVGKLRQCLVDIVDVQYPPAGLKWLPPLPPIVEMKKLATGTLIADAADARFRNIEPRGDENESG